MTIAAQSDEAKDMYRTYASRLDANQDIQGPTKHFKSLRQRVSGV